MRYAIYSAEGFAREILPSLRRSFANSCPDVVLVDDDPDKTLSIVHDCNVINFDSLCSEEHRDRKLVVAVADSKVRQLLAERCRKHGFSFFGIEDPSHIRLDNTEIGEGAIFCANTMLTGDCQIGDHFQCNIYSYIAHDCTIGDYVTFAPRVSCNGRVEIKDHAYLGTNAMLRQGTRGKPLVIGRGAVVGMGSVVLNDVPDGAVVAGSPARVIRMRDDS